MKQINSPSRLLCGFLVTAAAISLALGARAAAAPPKPLSARLAAAVDEAVEAELRRQQLIGVAVGIIRHGEVVLTKGYGLADREQNIPVTTETVFNWASNSKPLTAVAAMQLVQRKKLDLDSDVRRYVPEFLPNGPGITVRQLLCHQSGLPHWNNGRVVPSPDLDAKALASIDPLMSVRRFSQTPLLFEPGARMSYSSYGYILLSAVIERAGGESFYTQIDKRIARPLRLESLQLDTAENPAELGRGLHAHQGSSGRPVRNSADPPSARVRPRLESGRRLLQVEHRRLRQMGRGPAQRPARLQKQRATNVDASKNIVRRYIVRRYIVRHDIVRHDIVRHDIVRHSHRRGSRLLRRPLGRKSDNFSLRRATGDDEPPDPIFEAQKRHRAAVQLQLRQNGGDHEGRGDGTGRAVGHRNSKRCLRHRRILNLADRCQLSL
jgi:CubicO group peptidase (beta-lactamase class C family)